MYMSKVVNLIATRSFCAAITASAAAICVSPSAVDAQSRSQLVMGITENIGSYNPVADSVAFMSSVWCQVYGCLVSYDFSTGRYTGMLAERWEVADANTWIFHLRRDVKSHDGYPLKADDVVFSIKRMQTDPRSKQRANVAQIKSAEAIDPHTVKVTTKQPTAGLLEYITDRLMIMQKRLVETHGAAKADREYPFGFGPYRLKELVIDSRVVLEKNPDWPGVRRENPDVVIYRLMREAEQRVTALLNGEIHIAQYVPPHLARRIEQSAGYRIESTPSIEMMFLAMSPKVKPWDNRKLRQAVAYAIDREEIIRTVLQGQAVVLHGPLSRGQYGYDPALQPKYRYDPERARSLVREAGFPDGVDVELFTPVGRYVNDKQAAQAMTAMLSKVGIRTTLKTPEWSTLWSDVQRGRVPFFYMGRGGMIGPGPAISQYFETGGSPRIKYSNPEVDALLRKSRETFDENEYRKLVNQAFSIILNDAPAHFLWQQKILYGVADGVSFSPRPDHRVFGHATVLKK
jgi:peptide/nickel transport system substrate-binding protein